MKGRIGWLRIKEPQFEDGGQTVNIPKHKQEVVWSEPDKWEKTHYVQVVMFEVEDE